MRVIITGATGFIGSNLARAFLARGDEVYALVRPDSPRLGALPRDPKLFAVACDLAHVREAVPRIGRGDAFFHMAWGGVNREEIDSPEVQKKNVEESLECVRVAHAMGCRLFMDAGSRVEYGRAEGLMTESLDCHPINAYGKAKWEFYNRALPLCRELGMDYCHLRFFSVYGYGDHPWSIISTLVRDLRQDKKVALSACLHDWNFMYIDDAVRAVVLLCRRFLEKQGEISERENAASGRQEPPEGLIVNIASRDTRQLKSFVEEIHQIVGGRGELEYGAFVQAKEGALSVRPDVERLSALLAGWEEKYTFRRGILEMIEKEETSAGRQAEQGEIPAR